MLIGHSLSYALLKENAENKYLFIIVVLYDKVICLYPVDTLMSCQNKLPKSKDYEETYKADAACPSHMGGYGFP